MTCGARILDLDYETERQDEWMILDTIAASAKERVAAAKEALHRCKVQGEKAAGVMKNGAALYENGYLVGAVGIYGGNEKMNNEKAQLAMEMLKGAVQR